MTSDRFASRWATTVVIGALTVAIFVIDVFTDWAIAVAVLYVVPVLLALRLFSAARVKALATTCVVLALLGSPLNRFGSAEAGLVNLAISIVAIITTSYLGLRTLALETASHEARAHLQRLSRIGNLGELASSIAHEVNQPLAALSSSAGACRRWLEAEPPDLPRACESLDRIVRSAAGAAEVVAGVRRLAGRNDAVPERTDLADLIGECVAIARAEIEKQQIRLMIEIEGTLPQLRIDRVQIQQVVVNLLLNAIESLAGDDRGERSLRVVARSAGSTVALIVADNGPGLSADAERHLWEPFWTEKKGGVGLGLTMSRAIAEAHGGALRFDRPPGGGALFELNLPLTRAERE